MSNTFEENFYNSLTSLEKETISRYEYHIQNDIQNKYTSIFMNDGYAELDSQGYPIERYDINFILSNEKFKDWKYQVLMYVGLLKLANITFSRSKGCIVDFSCGKGGGVALYESFYNFNKVVGLDIQSSHLEIAKSHTKRTEFFLSSFSKIPLQDASVDVMTNVEALGYYEDLPKFFSEVARVLKPEGKFLISTAFYPDLHERFLNALNTSPFVIDSQKDITSNVRMACGISKAKAFSQSKMLYEIFLFDEQRYYETPTPYRYLVLRKQ